MPKADRPPKRPPPAPLETDDRKAVLVGSALWLAALLLLATVFRDDLQRHHATWWLWTCGIGIAMGLYGLRFVARRRR